MLNSHDNPECGACEYSTYKFNRVNPNGTYVGFYECRLKICKNKKAEKIEQR